MFLCASFPLICCFSFCDHLGKLVLLPNFGARAFCRKHLMGLLSGDQNSVLWGRPYVHCIGLSLAKLIPVSSLLWRGWPWPSYCQALSLCGGYWCLVARLGHKATFCKAFAHWLEKLGSGLVIGALGPRSVFDLVTGGASSWHCWLSHLKGPVHAVGWLVASVPGSWLRGLLPWSWGWPAGERGQGPSVQTSASACRHTEPGPGCLGGGQWAFWNWHLPVSGWGQAQEDPASVTAGEGGWCWRRQSACSEQPGPGSLPWAGLWESWGLLVGTLVCRVSHKTFSIQGQFQEGCGQSPGSWPAGCMRGWVPPA